MSKMDWLTPSQAIEMLSAHLPTKEPLSLAIWGRDGCLRTRAKVVRKGDGMGYSDYPELGQALNNTWWKKFWNVLLEDNPLANKRCSLNWTTGEITTYEQYDTAGFDVIEVRGIEFNRSDLIVCIRTAKGQKATVPRANPEKVREWVDEFLEKSSPSIPERKLVTEIKCQFPGLKGAITCARDYLRELRRAQGGVNKGRKKLQ